ncbi:MAG: hypothetical protein V5A62_13365 [Haloarculaceae archaeon]
MSTTTPTTEARTTTESETGTDDGPRPGTTDTGRPDRWAAETQATGTETEATGSAPPAPRTFDPFCTRRLRNCVDGENAAFPDTDRYGRL